MITYVYCTVGENITELAFTLTTRVLLHGNFIRVVPFRVVLLDNLKFKVRHRQIFSVLIGPRQANGDVSGLYIPQYMLCAQFKLV